MVMSNPRRLLIGEEEGEKLEIGVKSGGTRLST